jgi:hypothetical protein
MNNRTTAYVLFIVLLLAPSLSWAGKKYKHGKYVFSSTPSSSPKKGYQVYKYQGKIVSQEIFDDYKDYDFNFFAIAKKDGKWGVIDENANILIPFQFQSIEYLSLPDGSSLWGNHQAKPLKQTRGYFEVTQDGKTGFIDNTGAQLVAAAYQKAFMWLDAKVAYVRKDDMWGMVDINGKVLVPFEYDLPAPADGRMCILKDKNNKLGAFDQFGKPLLPFKFDEVDYDDNTVFRIGTKWGRVDNTGNERLPFVYDSIYCTHKPYLFLVKKENKWTILKNNKETVQVSTLGFDGIVTNYFGIENTFAAKTGSQWQIVSYEGKTLTLLDADEVIATDEQGYVLRKGKKYGMVSGAGVSLVPAVYDSISIDDISEGYGVLRVYNDHKCGVYSTDQKKEMVPCRFDDVDPFEITDNPYGDKFIQVKLDGEMKMFLLDPKFKAYGDAVKVSDFIMMNRAETSIKEWLWYCYTHSAGDPIYDSDMPDTNAINPLCRIAFRCRYSNMYEDPNVEGMKIYPSFPGPPATIYFPKGRKKEMEDILAYPITGITYGQALAFCTWVTNNSNEYNYYDGVDVVMRLPTETEWETTARSGLNSTEIASDAHDSVNIKGCMLFRYEAYKGCPYFENIIKMRGKETVRVWDFFPDNNGFYNFFGNVAEMTATKGITKGGSFAHHAQHAGIKDAIPYDGPNNWTGFRYLFEFKPN